MQLYKNLILYQASEFCRTLNIHPKIARHGSLTLTRPTVKLLNSRPHEGLGDTVGERHKLDTKLLSLG